MFESEHIRWDGLLWVNIDSMLTLKVKPWIMNCVYMYSKNIKLIACDWFEFGSNWRKAIREFYWLIDWNWSWQIVNCVCRNSLT